MTRAQTTIASSVTLEGTTLFTGVHCTCRIEPARADSGVHFVRNGIPIHAHTRNLSDQPIHPAFEHTPPRCTAVGAQNEPHATVWTTEHLCAALAGLGIDNATVTLDAPEPPILDGSAIGFVHTLHAAGLTTLDATTDPIVVRETIRVEHDDAFIEISPSGTTRYEYTIDYGPESPIPRATAVWNADRETFATKIAPARTFCLAHEAHALRKLGLFEHLTERDMLVIDDDGPIGNTLRDPHECALHKLLDLIGDLALAGAPVVARVRAHKSGHTLAHRAARALTQG